MDCASTLDRTRLLRQLMQEAGVPSFHALSQRAGISDESVLKLRRGQIAQMRLETLIKLSQALGIEITELLSTFSVIPAPIPSPQAAPAALEALQQEYERLQDQLAQQQQELERQFQQTSLQTIESWLLQWPTAAYAAQQNPQAPAVKLLPLVRPVEQLVQQWGVVAIAPVGSEVAYDPQRHQLLDGSAQPGDRVKIRYTGYLQGDRLLYRARVSPLP